MTNDQHFTDRMNAGLRCFRSGSRQGKIRALSIFIECARRQAFRTGMSPTHAARERTTNREQFVGYCINHVLYNLEDGRTGLG